MNLKKYMPLLIGGVLCLVLSIGAIFFLLKNKGSHSEVQNEVERLDTKLLRLQKRNPFPSDENVTVVKKNHETLNLFFETLLADLSKGQKETRPMEPAQFGAFLENTIRGLRKAAAENGVALPEGFAFGFDLFIRGAQPKSDQIPRLQKQVYVIEELMMNLFSCGIQELVSVERDKFDQQKEEEFETGTRRSSRRRGRNQPQPVEVDNTDKVYEHDLFFQEDVTITFYTREKGVWEVLDLLASSRLFTIVKNAELMNKLAEGGRDSSSETEAVSTAIKEALQPPPAPKTLLPGETPPPVEPLEPPSRDERIIAGRENVKVSLDLSVFRFKPLAASSEEQVKKP